jgi:hypothetical protein
VRHRRRRLHEYARRRGSLLTLPTLILLGLPANAANRVGVTMQNIVAFALFARLGL